MKNVIFKGKQFILLEQLHTLIISVKLLWSIFSKQVILLEGKLMMVAKRFLIL